MRVWRAWTMRKACQRWTPLLWRPDSAGNDGAFLMFTPCALATSLARRPPTAER